jgi:Protein of unknown function (DUF2934)
MEKPMPEMEEAIRERAYHLWVADGHPNGNTDSYWLRAQWELIKMSLEGSSVIAATPHRDFGLTTPVKKATAARSGKRKSRVAE